MIKTVEAVIDDQGRVRLLEPVKIARTQRALVTILEEEPAPDLQGVTVHVNYVGTCPQVLRYDRGDRKQYEGDDPDGALVQLRG